MVVSTDVFPYQTVENDPLKVQQYTLPNGLKVFMSVNKEEPRIYTNISVRSGSKQDPPETTGLAHYMEHMLFKGTSKIGATDWEKESIYLEKIAELYEQHRKTANQEDRKAIYAEIDRLSYEAAQLVAPNEYDKLAGAIGAKGTNAYTWLEQTVYLNDIPANELERWMKLESERFRMMALRLFHTELETVYEEFNMIQDRDFRKVNNVIRKALFPNHPYGTQTTIGTAEHLKNPSHHKIQWYFKTYYVPNNMALILAGDFEPDEVIRLAHQYFGDYLSKELPPFTFSEQPTISTPVRENVYGQEAAFVDIAWRVGSAQTDDPFFLSLINGLLHNGQAGLIDIHLNQQQQLLDGEAWTWIYEDYSVLGLFGRPRTGQSLQQVEALLLQQLDLLRKGEFEEALLQAVVRDIKLQETKSYRHNSHRVGAMNTAFLLGVPWEKVVKLNDWNAKVTKADIVHFVQEKLRPDNFVVVYKNQGVDPNVIKVDKPSITPLILNRDALSSFGEQFLAAPAPPLQPQFTDFKEQIKSFTLQNGLQFSYVNNPSNALFRLDYIFEMGKANDPILAIALIYFPYLGTDRYSAAALQWEFFRLGLSFDVVCYDERSYISLSGLEESFAEGLQLFEHILANVRGDANALKNMVADLLLKRENAKKDKQSILRDALGNYARYGAHSHFTYRLSKDQLEALEVNTLVQKIKSLCHFDHQVYYYGQNRPAEVIPLLEKYHQVPTVRLPIPPPKKFVQLASTQNEVLFLDFPQIQTDVLLVSRGTPHFSLEEHLMREWFNEYFGYGLSSIVFQEIRESRALAYSTYAIYTSPQKADLAHYLQAYLGTQPDKLPDAIPFLLNILENMPVVETSMENARLSILKRMESSRIPSNDVFWEAQKVKDLGFEEDLDKLLYERLKSASLDDLLHFQKTHVKDRYYSFLVLGDKRQTDLKYLETFGSLRTVDLEEVFGY
ncbi:MAG: insulinase family protein [Saprospiraceae bacterium]